MSAKQVFTITFSESVENHKGMEILGQKAERGFSDELLEQLAAKYDGEIIVLNDENADVQDPASVCIFRNGLQKIFGINPSELFAEQDSLAKDSKCLMYGRVVNKKARHNLCFDTFDQSPEYEVGKGTVVSFDSQPLLKRCRIELGDLFGPEFQDLKAEGNYYYDVKKCYIGFHGDTERSKVVGIRLSSEDNVNFPLYYQWYHKSKPQGELMSLDLYGGDIYIMSEKAVGNDWKKKNTWTLRHAAGELKSIKK